MKCPGSAQILFVAIECYDDAPVYDIISAMANDHADNIVQAKVSALDFEIIRDLVYEYVDNIDLEGAVDLDPLDEAITEAAQMLDLYVKRRKKELGP